ncbi:hypothetical protein BS50DRAFT_630903 [Corynespora cassiicola Philippines]|uniref:C3H1-type domain-containing protein n=1 Tax=Corynespora cassiicola Philippines TaxID=1448308 RepID=A0A2T2NZZ3_CORCC|nr:hypothetical protein BS50DRAFT_630903 [Corynespora cassiicola Philippines]
MPAQIIKDKLIRNRPSKEVPFLEYRQDFKTCYSLLVANFTLNNRDLAYLYGVNRHQCTLNHYIAAGFKEQHTNSYDHMCALYALEHSLRPIYQLYNRTPPTFPQLKGIYKSYEYYELVRLSICQLMGVAPELLENEDKLRSFMADRRRDQFKIGSPTTRATMRGMIDAEIDEMKEHFKAMTEPKKLDRGAIGHILKILRRRDGLNIGLGLILKEVNKINTEDDEAGHFNVQFDSDENEEFDGIAWVINDRAGDIDSEAENHWSGFAPDYEVRTLQDTYRFGRRRSSLRQAAIQKQRQSAEIPDQQIHPGIQAARRPSQTTSHKRRTSFEKFNRHMALENSVSRKRRISFDEPRPSKKANNPKSKEVEAEFEPIINALIDDEDEDFGTYFEWQRAGDAKKEAGKPAKNAPTTLYQDVVGPWPEGHPSFDERDLENIPIMSKQQFEAELERARELSKHGIPSAPPAHRPLPWEDLISMNITMEELIIYFPNHVLKNPTLALYLRQLGWDRLFFRTARLINLARRSHRSQNPDKKHTQVLPLMMKMEKSIQKLDPKYSLSDHDKKWKRKVDSDWMWSHIGASFPKRDDYDKHNMVTIPEAASYIVGENEFQHCDFSLAAEQWQNNKPRDTHTSSAGDSSSSSRSSKAPLHDPFARPKPLPTNRRRKASYEMDVDYSATTTTTTDYANAAEPHTGWYESHIWPPDDAPDLDVETDAPPCATPSQRAMLDPAHAPRPCGFDPKCKKKNCSRAHPLRDAASMQKGAALAKRLPQRVCRFGARCRDKGTSCPYPHPEGGDGNDNTPPQQPKRTIQLCRMQRCGMAECPLGHRTPAAPPGAGGEILTSVWCGFGVACRNAGCNRMHPSPAGVGGGNTQGTNGASNGSDGRQSGGGNGKQNGRGNGGTNNRPNDGQNRGINRRQNDAQGRGNDRQNAASGKKNQTRALNGGQGGSRPRHDSVVEARYANPSNAQRGSRNRNGGSSGGHSTWNGEDVRFGDQQRNENDNNNDRRNNAEEDPFKKKVHFGDDEEL